MKKPNFKTITFTIITTMFLGIIFYNVKDVLIGSPLSIKTIKDGTTLYENFIPISGKTKQASLIRINGRAISVDKKGIFSDGVLLSPGYNIIEINQRDRFGKERNKVLRLVAEPTESFATNITKVYKLEN